MGGRNEINAVDSTLQTDLASDLMEVEKPFWALQLQIVDLPYKLGQLLPVLHEAMSQAPTTAPLSSAEFDAYFDWLEGGTNFPNNLADLLWFGEGSFAAEDEIFSVAMFGSG